MQVDVIVNYRLELNSRQLSLVSRSSRPNERLQSNIEKGQDKQDA